MFGFRSDKRGAEAEGLPAVCLKHNSVSFHPNTIEVLNSNFDSCWHFYINKDTKATELNIQNRNLNSIFFPMKVKNYDLIHYAYLFYYNSHLIHNHVLCTCFFIWWSERFHFAILFWKVQNSWRKKCTDFLRILWVKWGEWYLKKNLTVTALILITFWLIKVKKNFISELCANWSLKRFAFITLHATDR